MLDINVFLKTVSGKGVMIILAAYKLMNSPRLYATFLLYVGFPIFMQVRQSKGFFFASAIWGVGLLLLVTILVSMILHWNLYLDPEYVDLQETRAPNVAPREPNTSN